MILNIKADQTTIGNIITFVLSQTLDKNDMRRKFIMPDVSKQSLKSWIDELVALNKDNKEFMDVILQL
jgi:hypothetical protein